jgi:hypothetical protein
LPNSLTKVLPFAWVSSTRLPVSVCGTSTRRSSFSGFSRQVGLRTCGPKAPPSRFHLRDRICLAPSTASTLGTRLSSTGLRSPLASPRHSRQVVQESSPVVHRLRPAASAKARLTRRGLTLRRKPETYGEHGSHMFCATHASILTRGPSNGAYRAAFVPATTLPYHSRPGLRCQA